MVMVTVMDMNDIPQDPLVRPGWIVAALHEHGDSVAELARRHGVAAQNISAAIHHRSSERIERAIAERLGIRPHALFPERFDADDLRIRLPRPQPTKRQGKVVKAGQGEQRAAG